MQESYCKEKKIEGKQWKMRLVEGTKMNDKKRRKTIEWKKETREKQEGETNIKKRKRQEQINRESQMKGESKEKDK